MSRIFFVLSHVCCLSAALGLHAIIVFYKRNLILLSSEESVAAAAVPPPPPPPPANIKPPSPPQPTAPSAENSPQPIKRNTSRQSIVSDHSLVLQEELASVLTLVRERGSKQKYLDIKQTPETYINQQSTPNEVQDWLDKKGFSETIRARFEGIGGYGILGMQKKELELCAGRIEGRRLYSQLNIQKSYSGVSISHTFKYRFNCVYSEIKKSRIIKCHRTSINP